jgi:hypothetical protein
VRRHVRFGSQADICSATRHVRFTPNSDRKSGHAATVMSALHLKADVCGANPYVCFGPEADIPLFDDVVGAPDECVRDVEAERLGRLQIDSQVYFCSLLDR